MSPAAEARAELARLLAETREDVASAERRAAELRALVASDERWHPGSPHLSVAALALHHYYTAVESFLERVARTFEGKLPTDADWHRALLHGATLELEGVRPAVLSPGAESCLVELLRFRHFVRHAYAAELDADRLRDLAGLALRCAATVAQELEAFRGHLSRAATVLDREP